MCVICTSWVLPTFVRHTYFMNAKHLYALTILHVSTSPLCTPFTSWRQHTLMSAVYFMRHEYFLCLALTSCTPSTLMRDKHFMNWIHFYEWHSLHVSYSPLWNNFTSWDSLTLMYTKYFMWTCKYCTLMWYIHFMTEVNFYGLPLLHGRKTPLCVRTTSCFQSTFMPLLYFMHTLYFNEDPLLHEVKVPCAYDIPVSYTHLTLPTIYSV